MSTTKLYPKSFVSEHRVYRRFVDGHEEESTNSPQTVKWTDSVVTGDNIPNWREALKTGQNATTSMQVVSRSVKATRGFMVEYRKVNPFGNPATTTRAWLMDGHFGLPGDFSADPNTLSDSNANNKALSKFNQKVRSALTSFEGGVFLGELVKTIHGIRHPAESLRKLVDAYGKRARALRQGHRAASLRKHFPRVVSDLWLEHAFHWTPLFSDVESGVNTLVDFTMKNKDHPDSKRVTATGIQEASVSYPPSGHSSGGLAWRAQHTDVDRVTVVYRGAVRISNPTVPSLERVGLNPLSFLPTAWELVPYSFLIDYFTNVGDIVTSVANLGASLRWSNKTVIKETEARFWATADATLWSNDLFHESFTFSAPELVYTRKTINRAAYSGSFIPGLILEVPGAGSKKWLNIAALAVSQAIDKKFRW